MAVELVKIVSKNFDIPDSHKLEVALKNGRYESIDKAFSMQPDEVTEEVCKSVVLEEKVVVVPLVVLNGNLCHQLMKDQDT
ncbi:MAG: hypothetical protein ACNI22_04760 [Halarcobacter sp.]